MRPRRLESLWASHIWEARVPIFVSGKEKALVPKKNFLGGGGGWGTFGFLYNVGVLFHYHYCGLKDDMGSNTVAHCNLSLDKQNRSLFKSIRHSYSYVKS